MNGGGQVRRRLRKRPLESHLNAQGGRPGPAATAIADALADAIGFEIPDHYTPVVPTYFSRVTTAQIATAHCEAKGAPRRAA